MVRNYSFTVHGLHYGLQLNSTSPLQFGITDNNLTCPKVLSSVVIIFQLFMF